MAILLAPFHRGSPFSAPDFLSGKGPLQIEVRLFSQSPSAAFGCFLP
jgi:hypothetical protein